MKRTLVLSILLVLFGAACAQDDPTVEAPEDDTSEELSVEFSDAPKTVEGNVAVLDVDVTGLELVAADGDDSGDTGHLHFFIDKDPVDEGEVIPKEAGVVHSATPTTSLYLSVGEHEITVVPGNGLHERLGSDVEDTITLEVEGPSVDGSAPATLEEGEDLEVTIESEGVDIVAPSGEMSEGEGHYAVLLDPKEPPEAGAKMPMEDGKYVHTPEDSVTFEDLEKGEHTVWVVLVDGMHMAFDPAVMDKLTVTVS